MTKHLLSTVIILLYVGTAWGIPPAPWEADELIGKDAPGFSLPDLKGNTITLKDLHGKVVIVNFWATWCPPCRTEISPMNTLLNKFRGKGLEIIAISSDPEKSVVERFIENNTVDFQVLHDPENRVGQEYKVYSLPMSYVVDRDGTIIRKIFGAYEWDSKESFSTFMEILAQ